MDNLKPALVDVPVLLIFFTRPDAFKKVFDKVKKSRPTKLFLACDGARADHPDDQAKIDECKKIAEDIDWKCEVYKNYAEENMGCGIFPQSAITWAFENVDRLVVLEDDCVPLNNFFAYMAEMLERYKDDERIGLISGFNHLSDWDCGEYSYFYTRSGPMAGAWGSWKRVWDMYDFYAKASLDPFVSQLIYNDVTAKRAKKGKVSLYQKAALSLQNSENISYWDVQFGFLKYYQSLLSIVPCFSLASNIGLGAGSTHAKNASNTIPSIFFAPERNFVMPIRHPDFVICDHRYDEIVDSKLAFPHPIIRNFKRGIRLLKRIFGLV